MRPAFSKAFTPKRRDAWVFIGCWEPAVKLARGGASHVLCTPPDSDPLECDWSVLGGCNVIAWVYQPIDVLRFVAVLRAAGALDISCFDVIAGEFLVLALTDESENMLADFKSEAA